MSFELEFNGLMPLHLCLLYTVDQKYKVFHNYQQNNRTTQNIFLIIIYYFI